MYANKDYREERKFSTKHEHHPSLHSSNPSSSFTVKETGNNHLKSKGKLGWSTKKLCGCVVLIGVGLLMLVQYIFVLPMDFLAQTDPLQMDEVPSDHNSNPNMHFKGNHGGLECSYQEREGERDGGSGSSVPTLYNMKTKMHVTYEGGHWFHMAENFMTQHSILRADGGGTNSSEVYFNFDKQGFVGEMNGITKFMTALAVLQDPQFDSITARKKAWEEQAQRPVDSIYQSLHSPPNISNISNISPIPVEKDGRMPGGISRRELRAGVETNNNNNNNNNGNSNGNNNDMAPVTLHFVHFPLDKKEKASLEKVEKVEKGGNGDNHNHVKVGGSHGVALYPSSFIDHHIVKLDPSMSPSERFTVVDLKEKEKLKLKGNNNNNNNKGYAALRSDNSIDHTDHSQPQQHSQQSQSQSVCARFGGTLGGVFPTPQRGHWFPNPGDIDSFRSKMKRLCPAHVATLESTSTSTSSTKGLNSNDNNPNINSNNKKKRKMVIYQRDRSRTISNLDQALPALAASLTFTPAEWDISVLMHTQDRSVCDIAHRLSDCDVLLTPHGFQSMLLLFLPRPALLFEVFPYRYYKRGYGPLGGEYGIIHSGVMSPGLTWHRRWLLKTVTTATCMLNKYCRNYARGDDVHLTAKGIQALERTVKEKFLPSIEKGYAVDSVHGRGGWTQNGLQTQREELYL